MIRARGQFDNRRYWGIEMNEVRQLYLGNYSHIDSIYHLITNCHIKYRCWEYWHSPIIHAMYIYAVAACEIYIKVKEGDIDQTWKDDNIFGLWIFCDLLSNWMIKYNLTHSKYAGDANMRPVKYQNQVSIDKSNYSAREEIERPLSEEVQ